jgi:histidyl-tRNA synthetase
MLASAKGTHDILPAETATWQYVEETARRLMALAHVQEIRTPLFETTELFQRGVGEATDIVNKEMYTFQKGDRSLTLRPENTAGVVRAYIQNGLDRAPKPVKVFYLGPMFRYERPQAGRQRQFHQLGVECFGLDTPETDAALIELAMRLFETLHVPGLALEVNNVGTFEGREVFKEKLKGLLKDYLPSLCEDCQTRYENNPLRMLDCKVPGCKTLYQGREIQEFLKEDPMDEDSRRHFQEVCRILSDLGIAYTRNPMLVRGLDYYTKTVFEITSTHLGAQNAVCGGGRYNNLVKTLDGPDTPAFGWALGMERLVSLLPNAIKHELLCYVVSDSSGHALELSRTLQQEGLSAVCDWSGKPFGKQLALAAKSGAAYAVIQGESERLAGQFAVKNMQTQEQQTLSWKALLTILKKEGA